MFSNPGLEISQQLPNTFQVGQSYQLTVGIEGGGYGMVLGCPMEIGLYYLDGGGNQVMVGTTTVLNDIPAGNITDLPDRQLIIPAVAASDPWAGQNIGVALIQTADFQMPAVTGTSTMCGWRRLPLSRVPWRCWLQDWVCSCCGEDRSPGKQTSAAPD